MALLDLTDRSATVRAGERVFMMRPISVLGMHQAQRILASGLPQEEAIAKDWLDQLHAAAADSDPAAAVPVLAKLYLQILEGLGRERFCEILALVCEPGERQIRAAIDEDSVRAPAAFIAAAGQLHDFARILRKLTERSADPVPAFIEESEGIGLETVILDVATFLPGYRLEEILAWPYERFITVQEQMNALRALRCGKPAKLARSRPAASTAELKAIGINVQTRRRRTVAPEQVH